MRDKNDVVEGIVDAIVPGGRGILRDVGGVVLARGGLPGERVQVRVERTQRGVRHGVVLRVITPSTDRVEADCAQHGTRIGRCGGCDLLELSRPAALRVRERIVEDALVRVGRFDRELVAATLRPIVAATPAHDGARRRAKLVIRNHRPTFSSPESRERVPVERCPALHPVLEHALRALPSARLTEGSEIKIACDDRGHVSVALERARPADAAHLVEAGIAHGALVLGRDEREAARVGDPTLRGEVAPGFLIPESDGGDDLGCGSDAAVFTQATRFGGRAILDEVLRAAGPVSGAHVLELFAGAGHLTVPLLAGGAHVHAVEGAARSVDWLRHNTVSWRERCSVRQAFIDGSLELPARVDVVVADPPRTGIPGLSALLARLPCERLVLVSCDPATGARDLAHACAAGFTLAHLTPIDAFPRTSHVEWVATLTRTRAHHG